jgi:magnesium-transporting ATPase (P-type)
MTTTIPLNYLSRDHDLKRRPACLYVIAILSIIYASIGLLADAFMEFFSWLTPQMRPSQMSAFDLCYRIEFYLCALAMLWLLIAAIRVFTSKSRGFLNPYEMLGIYVACKIALAAAFVFLNSLDHFDPNPIVFWLIFMCFHPVLVAIILARKSVRDYYAGAAQSDSPAN